MNLGISAKPGTLLHRGRRDAEPIECRRNVHLNRLEHTDPGDPWPPLAVIVLGPLCRLHEDWVEFGERNDLDKDRDALSV